MLKRFNIGRAARNTIERAAKRAQRIWRSPEKRDRVKMHLAFALVFALLVTGTDYVITGGVEWNPGGEAFAMEMPQTAQSAEPVVRAGPLPPAAAEEEFVELAPIDYSFTTETLLGGPDTVLAEYRPFADGVTREPDKPDDLASVIETGKSKS